MSDDVWNEARALIPERMRGREGFYRALWGYAPREGAARFHLDRYGEWWLVVVHASEAEAGDLSELFKLLNDSAKGVAVKFRNDDKKSTAAGRVFSGDPSEAEALVVQQTGYVFEAHLTSDLDAGAYPDAEDLRQELLHTSQSKRVLNLFAYTCLFGVCACKGGARVLNVDVSRHCLKWGQRNYELNGLRVDGRDFIASEALKFLRRAAREGQSWDTVIVDPPPFFSVGKLRRASDETIEECLEAALAVTSPGGIVHLLQCTARVTVEELVERARAVLGKSALRGEVVGRGSTAVVSSRELAPTFKEARITIERGSQ